jgi:hypothetical protein
MLPLMIDGWVLWLLLAGLGIGAVSAWLLTVRLQRDEDDIDARERREEAAWIATTIEQYGGVAPRAFVEEVLDLHQTYLSKPTRARDVLDTPSADPPHLTDPYQPQPPEPPQPPEQPEPPRTG